MPIQHRPHFRLQILPLDCYSISIFHRIVSVVHLLPLRLVQVRTHLLLGVCHALDLRLGAADDDDCRHVPHGPCCTRDVIRGADCTLTRRGVGDSRPQFHGRGLRSGADHDRVPRHAVVQLLLLRGITLTHDAQPKHIGWHTHDAWWDYVHAVCHNLVQKVCHELSQGSVQFYGLVD